MDVFKPVPKHRSVIFLKFLPFWLFMIFFKSGASLHYSLLSPLGERLLPLWIVGAVVGFASFIQFVLDVPTGKLLDRFGYKRLMVLGTLLFIISALCFTLPFSMPVYLVSIFFSVFGWVLFGPGTNAYVLASANEENTGKFMSLHDVSCSIGVVFASLVLPITLLLPPAYMGWAMVALLSISLIFILATPKERHTVQEASSRGISRHMKQELRAVFKTVRRLNPASTSILLLHLASGIFYGMVWFVVPLIIQSQENGTLLGIGLGIFDFSVVVLGFLIGVLADRADKRRLVFFGLLIFAIFGMMLGFDFGIFFILFGFLATAGEELAGLSLWSWLYSLDTEHDSDGAISGVISLFEDFGWMVGPLLAGILFGIVGPSWTIVVGALPILVVWVVYLLNTNTHERQHPLVPREHRLHRKRHKS